MSYALYQRIRELEAEVARLRERESASIMAAQWAAQEYVAEIDRLRAALEEIAGINHPDAERIAQAALWQS